ncbi:MAG: hypothetical protein JNJ46_12840 [Myxococcales bacterium]|nr:hypothetical protein [Myxococcales bacterium]
MANLANGCCFHIDAKCLSHRLRELSKKPWITHDIGASGHGSDVQCKVPCPRQLVAVLEQQPADVRLALLGDSKQCSLDAGQLSLFQSLDRITPVRTELCRVQMRHRIVASKKLRQDPVALRL